MLRGVFGRNDVYAGVTGWENFEPWLSQIEVFVVWAIPDERLQPAYAMRIAGARG